MLEEIEKKLREKTKYRPHVFYRRRADNKEISLIRVGNSVFISADNNKKEIYVGRMRGDRPAITCKNFEETVEAIKYQSKRSV